MHVCVYSCVCWYVCVSHRVGGGCSLPCLAPTLAARCSLPCIRKHAGVGLESRSGLENDVEALPRPPRLSAELGTARVPLPPWRLQPGVTHRAHPRKPVMSCRKTVQLGAKALGESWHACSAEENDMIFWRGSRFRGNSPQEQDVPKSSSTRDAEVGFYLGGIIANKLLGFVFGSSKRWEARGWNHKRIPLLR